MRLLGFMIIVLSMAFWSFNTQHNPIYKKWRLVAEEITYFNPDYTAYDGAKNRLDSVKNETVEFLADGSFKSREANGTYTISNDSIHLKINQQTVSYKYQLSDSKLRMETFFKKNEFMVRSRLYLE